MSENEKKREEQQGESTTLDHSCHEHPLYLTECTEFHPCYGCRRNIFGGETVYMCQEKCESSPILHEECAEMPPEIRLPTHHPQHTLLQKHKMEGKKVKPEEDFPNCAFCESGIMKMGYYCSSSCEFQIHVGCASNIDVSLSKRWIDHPSHPHRLTLQRRPGRSCSSRCDACGTIHKGNTYVCADCEYWVVESCANLPRTANYIDLHHHSLSLAFHCPQEYIKFDFSCFICLKGFLPKYWVYHCPICRYVVHLNCATQGAPPLKLYIKEEKDSFDHFYHKHPLTLSKAGDRSNKCYGCPRYIYPAETAYACREGCRAPILHEECAEMPREITLPMHPQHTLIQKEVWYLPHCAVCEKLITRIGYYCSSSSCVFQVHVGCAQDIGVVPTSIHHPSHPQHQLMMLWRPGRSCFFRCDACGTIDKGNSYICNLCQYWIHESCASLPATQLLDHLHHHPLSLVYHLPKEYIKFGFKCDICCKDLLPSCWAYHCPTCRYVAHIKCVFIPFSMTYNVDANAVEELIRLFLTKLGVSTAYPDEVLNRTYKFHNHDHQLDLISLSFQDQQQERQEEDIYDDGEFNHEELVCDACTTPIFPTKERSHYLSCGECKYFLHWTCFHLPPELPSHPLHLSGHNLSLQTRSKLDFTLCSICGFCTNGHFYKCTECEFKADIKCASLPETIKHAAHPQHHLNLLTKEATGSDNYLQRLCVACGHNTHARICYRCDICQIILHSSCAQLPALVSHPEWDKHPLPLTFDARVDHPSGFNCEICEKEMNPRSWMYHCRTCDFSLHPSCHPTASGEYRNIKFGQRYEVAVHHHPLTYQLLTKKLHCDVCGRRKVYGTLGFQCNFHNCEFCMCMNPCGRDRETAMLVVD